MQIQRRLQDFFLIFHLKKKAGFQPASHSAALPPVDPGHLTWQGPAGSSEGERPSSCRAGGTCQKHTEWWAGASAAQWSSALSSVAHGGCNGWADMKSRYMRAEIHSSLKWAYLLWNLGTDNERLLNTHCFKHTFCFCHPLKHRLKMLIFGKYSFHPHCLLP